MPSRAPVVPADVGAAEEDAGADAPEAGADAAGDADAATADEVAAIEADGSGTLEMFTGGGPDGFKNRYQMP